jgi:membrane fusion protein (multidrug efflux system)
MTQVEVMPRGPQTNGGGEELIDEMFKPFYKRPVARMLFAVIALLLLAGIFFTWRHYSAIESTDDAQIEGDIVPISARVGGTVKTVHVEDNQYVEAGTVLVEIDQSDYQVALRRAQAELSDASSNAQAARTMVPMTSTTTSNQLRGATAALNSAKKQVDAAQARVREAEANYKKAAADLARFKQLVEKDEIPRQTYDTAVAAEAQARAAVDTAQANVAAAESAVAQATAQMEGARTVPEQVTMTRAKAGAAEAAVEKNQSGLEQARLNLGYTVVRAPVSGIVSKKSVQPGQTIAPGQALFAIVPLENLWVVANFKENQLKDMRPGQEVKIRVDAYDKDYDGKVDSFGGATAAKFSLLPPENATGNYVKVVQRIPVKIVFNKGQDPEHKLRPGMSVAPTVRVK